MDAVVEAADSAAAGAASDTAPPASEPVETEDEADIVEQLPDIEDLDSESDYSVFMQDGVPEDLQRLALRKLWLSDPVLANVDGLVDYGEDFSIAETLGGAVKTIYQVGKGMIDETAEESEAADTMDEGADDSAERENPPFAQGTQADGDPPDQV